jgi:hypothetical protein
LFPNLEGGDDSILRLSVAQQKGLFSSLGRYTILKLTTCLDTSAKRTFADRVIVYIGQFLQIYQSSPNFSNCFFSREKSLTEKGLGYNLGDIFTNSSGHTVCQRKTCSIGARPFSSFRIQNKIFRHCYCIDSYLSI